MSREESGKSSGSLCRGNGGGMSATGVLWQHGKPVEVGGQSSQPNFREEQVGPRRVADRSVVAEKPGNAGGAKGP